VRHDGIRDVAYTITAFVGADVLQPVFASELTGPVATVIAACVSGVAVIIARQIEMRWSNYWRQRAAELERELRELREQLADLNPYGPTPYDD
jgi:Ni/Fe-hydrogenase subunit HybB-like protein